ncbi:hypothetical protein [Lacticaseibacillus paracasei]|uniref:hypothetical protein n=1 Tax=Lacticaseibacillus paracasei TaxID=1597 RepID=UPI0005159D53|nr:hypothetical protein [Lacticaseibacillus paracasei]
MKLTSLRHLDTACYNEDTKGSTGCYQYSPDKTVEDGRHSFNQSIKTVKLVKSLVTVFFLPLVKKKLI